jgi:hypothetical protein
MKRKHDLRRQVTPWTLAFVMVLCGGPGWYLLSIPQARGQDAGPDGTSGSEATQKCSGASPWKITAGGGPALCSCTNTTSSRTLGTCVTGGAGATCNPGTFAITRTTFYGPAPLTSATSQAICWSDFIACAALATSAGGLTASAACVGSVGVGCLAAIAAAVTASRAACACSVLQACGGCVFTGNAVTANGQGCN